MSEQESQQSEIDSLVDALDRLHPFSMDPNNIHMPVDEPNVVDQPTDPSMVAQAEYNRVVAQNQFLSAQLNAVHAAQPAPNLHIDPNTASTIPGATPVSSTVTGAQGLPDVVVSPPAAVFKNPLKMKTPPTYKGS